jgi:hypothetical protein
MTEKPRAGWESTFEEFQAATPKRIREALSAYIVDASPEQIRAWNDAIPPLQRQVEHTLLRDELASRYSAILEYELPMESRRPDVILLVGADVVVIELKGKRYPSQADLDQASAYARDLRNYHRECAGRLRGGSIEIGQLHPVRPVRDWAEFTHLYQASSPEPRTSTRHPERA